MWKSATILACLLAASSAAAKDGGSGDGWDYKATLYLWFPGMTSSLDTKFGNIASDGSSGDVLSALDMAFMGSFSAQHDKLSFVGDLLYTDLSTDKETPLPFYGDLSMRLRLTALSGYALYRVTSDPAVQLDLGAGFRLFNIGVTAAADAGTGPLGRPATSQDMDDTWTDPLIALRLRVPLNDDWFVMGFADLGGTSANDQTYQVYTGIGYTFAENWSTQLGYRYMNVTHPLEGNDLDLGLSGATIAVTYSF